MYERLLNKEEVPSFEQLLNYCNERKELLLNLHEHLIKVGLCEFEIRFPYGKKYGWSLTYRVNKKLICDVFSEDNSFTVMMRLDDSQYMRLYDSLSDYTKKYIDNRYPCGSGGWIHFRVFDEKNLDEIKMLLNMKLHLL